MLERAETGYLKGIPLQGAADSAATDYSVQSRRAGIVYARRNGGITAHDFRHSATTSLRRAGVDTMTAMKIIGHKSEKMHRRYNQISPADLHQAILKLVTYQCDQSSGADTVMIRGKLHHDS